VPTPFTPSATLRERWMRLRNFQSQDFWAMVFARPLTILLLLPLADRPWVTPDRLTWAANVTKAAGSALLAFGPTWAFWVVGIALVNLGLVIDNMDGTLARYRGTSSMLGYYFDKASDLVFHGAMFAAFGYRAWLETGQVVDLVLPIAAFSGQCAAGYAKWIATKVMGDAEVIAAHRDGQIAALVEKRTRQNPSTPPPERDARAWAVFVARAVASIPKFNEVDIPFFAAVAVVSGQWWIFTQVMCAFYAFGVIGAPILFQRTLRKHLSERGLT
jgi:phosphatidylglycerophosphate synthase